MLVRIETGEETGATLAATSLGDIGATKEESFSGQMVQVRRSSIGVAIAPKLRTIVLRDNQQDVGTVVFSASFGRK